MSDKFDHSVQAMTLEAIKYDKGKLKILNQLLLPHESIYEDIITLEDGWNAIKEMKVRGAPAIAIVGCLTLAVQLHHSSFDSAQDICTYVETSMDNLVGARPTAVNLSKAAKKFKDLSRQLVEECMCTESIKIKLVAEAEMMLTNDVNENQRLSEHGADHILNNCLLHESRCSVLTHCNTGSLATAGYGTALGVIRSLHARDSIHHVYCTETRPYNQGARLTAYELVHDKIPATLIADSMVALLFKTKQISAVVVGADRVAKNGDTANKIGTYQIAILAKYHNVPFYVAAPISSHCDVTEHGDDIVIEERKADELTSIHGVKIAAHGIGCWNPSFDVTDGDLITGGIITEEGVFPPDQLQKIFS